MKPLHLKVYLAAATLGLTAMSFSQLGTPPQGVTQPLVAAPGSNPVGLLTEGYFVTNGASYFTRNGTVFRVEREVSLRVLPTGMVGFDGQPLILPPGVMLTPDGRHAPIPAGINSGALPGNVSTFPSSPVEAGIQPAPAGAPAPVVVESDLPPVPEAPR